MRLLRLGVIVVPALFIWNCGSSTSVDPVNDAGSGNPKDSAAADTGNLADTGNVGNDGSTLGDSSTVDAADTGPACVENAACATNAGAPCFTGRVACAGGVATCVDATPATDGTTCSGGLCALGSCLAPQTINADVDLSLAPVTAGRTCAESPAFAISALTATGGTLATTPTGDCLAPGDEVLLVNQQGSTGAITNVGNWELLRIKSVQTTAIEFTTAKTKSYGSAAGGDANIGTGATDQKVALVRVPRFGSLTIAASKTLTSAAWSGGSGGILALRAAKLTVDGTIRAGAGYRAGRWSRDDGNCADSVQTESGESIQGPPVASTAAQAGASGGLGAGTNSFNGNTPLSTGASHATVGEAGKNPNGRTMGAVGTTYGTADGTRLTMGSGASGNLTCEVGFAGPALVASAGALAGGIVLLLAEQLDVSTTGFVLASAIEGTRDVSASGGYVFVRGNVLNVGSDRVMALGGTGISVNGSFMGQTVKSGNGYVVLDGTTFTGTTKPVANQL